jgi:hypothetical protein
MIGAAPWSRTPPVAWWQLWPVNGGGAKKPADGSPKDGQQYLALPVCNGLSIAAGRSVDRTVTLPEFGWTFRLGVIAVSPLKDLFLSIVDVGSGRKIVTDASAFAFVGGEGGKSFISYPYQFDQRSSIRFSLHNRGAASIKVDCAIMGQFFRGVV